MKKFYSESLFPDIFLFPDAVFFFRDCLSYSGSHLSVLSTYFMFNKLCISFFFLQCVAVY